MDNVSLQGNTALHLAAERGHTHVVEFLVDKFNAPVLERWKAGLGCTFVTKLQVPSPPPPPCVN